MGKYLPVYRDYLLNGKVLSIDPSSGGTYRGKNSKAGYAILDHLSIIESGVIELDYGKHSSIRLQKLLECLQRDFKEKFDLLVIEDVNGYNCSKVLLQASGVFVAAINSKATWEINIRTWQSIAKQLGGWEKDDEADAIYMMLAAISVALGYDPKMKKDDADIIFQQVRAINERDNT